MNIVIQTKFDYFDVDKNEWEPYDPYTDQIHFFHKFNLLINRQSIWHDERLIKQWWQIGGTLHRIDGPAVISNNKYLNYQKWYINGKCLYGFDYPKKEKDVFEYIQKRPQYIHEITLLTQHNKWLTENQILALMSLDLFKNEN